MPVYAYRCAECGEEFERLRGISQSDFELQCPVCGVPGKAKRLISTFSAFSKSGGITRPANQFGGNTGGGCNLGKGGGSCGCSHH